MEPSGPTSGIPAALTRPTGQATPPPLQVGQLLQATVLENQAGKVLLSLGHRQLSADSSLPFKPGQVLSLEVRSLGEPPVLKVLAALQASTAGITAVAVRTLLPRYGATTPLLANLPRLAQAPAGSLPPALDGAVRALLRNLPDRAALSTAQGVKSAIERSGSFLEHQLARPGSTAVPLPASLDSDFKANLLRVLAQLRNLSGADTPAATQGRPPAAPASAVPQQPPGQPPLPTTATDSTLAAQTAQPLKPGAGDPVTGGAAQQALKRVLAAAGTAQPRTSAAAQTAIPSPGSANPAGSPTPVTPGAPPPPPFPGAPLVPQSPVPASAEPPDNPVFLRLDLLQQTEAALARIHLNQLASLPREGEQRLVEWLFDIPVRRGETIDFWSARITRDGSEGRTAEPAQPLWSVQLAFDLPGLGPVQARINLQGERVSTWFRAARAETLPLLQAHLHELRQALLAAGLEVGTLDCQAGGLAAPARNGTDPLIDEQA